MAAFPDLQDKRWDWARSMIEEMSSQKIIMGFEDGSFRPAESVTKLQSLLLVARVLGVNEDINRDYAELAEEVYRNIIEPYGTEYTRDIAYLLYKGALSSQELSTYLSPANASSPLKRYEAAMILAKAKNWQGGITPKISNRETGSASPGQKQRD